MKVTQATIETIAEALERARRYYIEADIVVRKEEHLDPDPFNDESLEMIINAEKALETFRKIHA